MADAGGTQTTQTKRPFGVVFFTLFLDLLGFGIIIPIQPFYAERFGASPAVVTLLGASYSLMQFIFTPLWGRLSDRIGRRPVVLTSIATSAVGFLLFGLAGSLPMLFAARMLAGFGNANIATVQAIVADVTTGKDRAKGMGMVGAAFGLGFICGPAVGGYIGSLQMPWLAGFVASGLAVANFVFAYFRLPETRDRARTNPHARRTLFDFTALGNAFKHANIARILVVSFLVTMGFALMETALSLVIEHTWVTAAIDPASTEAQRNAGHGEASLKTMWVLLVVGVTAAVVQGGLIGRLQKKLGERNLVVAGVVILAASLIALPFIAHPGMYWAMFPVGASLAVGSGILQPSIASMLSRSASADDQGSVLGLGQSLSSLGRVAGPSISGLLFQAGHGVPFGVGAGLMGLAFLNAIFLKPVVDAPEGTAPVGH